jgi:PD-(D/E)XK nuclease superfamily
MALECGELMHQVFAAVRIWQLDRVQNLPKHARVTGHRIFGELRWNMVWNHCLNQTDERDQVLELCFAVLHSSKWKDEISDETRTMTNMELSTIVYVDEQLPKMDNWTIYVQDKDDAQSMVGIEQVFDVVLTYSDGYEIRYIGTVDGLVQKTSTGKYYVDENKTASRLNDAWRNAHDVRHQTTGYCAISTAVFPFKVTRCRVQGLRIKPGNKGEDIYPLEPIERTEDAFQHWATWVRENVEVYEKYKNDFEHATRRTHSCNRFFRPCSLLSFCGDTPEGRMLAFHEHMVAASLSPSERAVSEG